MTGAGLDRQPIDFAPPSITEAEVDAVARVLRSGWLSTGHECEQLELELAALVDAPYVVAVSSCTAALEIALDALRLAPGARIGVPTWTFAASASTVVRAGGVPVLLDVEADTLNVAPGAVEAAIADGIEGLVAVHFAGVPVAREVLDMASDAGIPVVEDAAHALGSLDHRGPVSGRDTAGACFSFYATKNLTSAEGGAIATHDEHLASFARRHRLHGLSRDAWKRYGIGAEVTYDLVEPGLKANLPDVLAAIARVQLSRFPTMQARRRQVVQRYRSLLADYPGIEIIPKVIDERSADHLFVVLLPEGTERGAVVAGMARDQVGSSVHFRPLHHLSWFAENATCGPGGTPVADRLAARALSLPLHPELADSDVDRVVASLVHALS